MARCLHKSISGILYKTLLSYCHKATKLKKPHSVLLRTTAYIVHLFSNEGGEAGGKKREIERKDGSLCQEKSRHWKLETWLSLETTMQQRMLFSIHVNPKMQVMQGLHQCVEQTATQGGTKMRCCFQWFRTDFAPLVNCSQVRATFNMLFTFWNVLWPASKFNRDRVEENWSWMPMFLFCLKSQRNVGIKWHDSLRDIKRNFYLLCRAPTAIAAEL